MAGGILQLVCNATAAENMWINNDPEITFFKKLFRRHTPFASEYIPLYFKSNLDFGQSSSATILSNGDLVHKIFFVCDIPSVSAEFINSKNEDVIKTIKNLNSQYIDNDFMRKLNNCINGTIIEYDNICNIIDENIQYYDYYKPIIISIINTLSKYQNKDVLINYQQKIFGKLLNKSNDNLSQNESFQNDSFKLEILDSFFSTNVKYNLVFELIKLIDLEQQFYSQKIPIIPIQNTGKYLANNFVNGVLPTVNNLGNNFGKDFYHRLNTHNAIIGAIESLSTSVPTVIIKPFVLNDCYDIYRPNNQNVYFDSTYYSSIIDPNFKLNFMLKSNQVEKYIQSNEFIPIDIIRTNDFIYPEIDNNYNLLFNTQANIMFDNIQSFTDLLFEHYRNLLFDSTENLFFNKSPTPSNIYSYILPTKAYDTKSNNLSDEKINDGPNVFNLNIWFFYFFKYLDQFDVDKFIVYVKDNVHKNLSNACYSFLRNMMVLLKINVDYYMHEISYYMNDMCSKSPSHDLSDTLKNYVPNISESTNQFNKQSGSNLLMVTLIFHRNIIPSIEDMFNFIYEFIENINCNDIENYLEVEIGFVDRETLTELKSTAKQLYQGFYNYFMNKYNKMHFEAEYHCEEINPLVQEYVNHFLTGTSIHDKFYQKRNLNDIIHQLEFYFISETIHIRELQKFYYNIFSNNNLIKNYVDDYGCELIDYFNSVLKTDLTQKYYKVDNIHRYNGESYKMTPYNTRFYGSNDNLPLVYPFDHPPVNPYGVNPDYYSHYRSVTDYVTIPTSNNQILCTEIPINLNNTEPINNRYNDSEYQRFEIDYFRLKHEIFHGTIDNPISDLYKIFISEYDFNVLKLYHLLQQLLDQSNTKPMLSDDLLYKLYITTIYLMNYINEDAGNDTVMSKSIMHQFLEMIEDYLNNQTENISENTINEMVELSDILLKNNQHNYTTDDLIKCNQYINLIKNTDKYDNGIIDRLQIIKYNFLSQYFIYSLESQNISMLKNLDNKFFFKNTGQIINEILQLVDNNPVLDDLSNMEYLYSGEFETEYNHLLCMDSSNLSRYFMNTFNIFTAHELNPIKKLSVRDIYDIIDTTFMSVREIYNICMNNGSINNILVKLDKYQDKLLNKLVLTNKIGQYFYDFLQNKPIEQQNKNDLIKIIDSFGIDLENYMCNKIIPLYNQLVLNNNKNSTIIILAIISKDLDSFFLPNSSASSFKQVIIEDLTNGNKEDPLYLYLKLIGNEYYSYLKFFLDYCCENDLDYDSITNPLESLDITVLKNDNNTNRILSVKDCLNYFMDYLWDHSYPSMKQFGFNEKISDVISKYSSNKSNKSNKSNESDKSSESSNHEDKISKIINLLSGSFDTNGFVLNRYLEEFTKNDEISEIQNLSEKSNIIYGLNLYLGKLLILLEQQYNSGLEIKNKISNILYRNKKACTAWIKKLAHYLVDEISISTNSEIIDSHKSDWFEIYSQTNLSESRIDGYYKMIGNIDELTIFSNNDKSSRTIILPLCFYFNRNIALSLPLNASINLTYTINIKLKELSDVLFKEEFSEYIDNTGSIVKPKLSNVHLMCEYIYLSNEERQAFVTKHLQYLVDEFQYSTTNITDNNLTPVYKIGTNKISCVVKKNGKKTTETYFNKGIYVDQNNINVDDNELILRKDLEVKPSKNKSGISNTMMQHTIIDTDPKIHFKRVSIENHFSNPTKMMAILIRPDLHIITDKRDYSSDYFFGEKQWSNYGVHSWYDFSQVRKIREDYYTKFRQKINNLEDPVYGFLNIINHTIENMKIPEIPDKLIKYCEQIKSMYIKHSDEIFDQSNIQKIRDNLHMLKINFDITNKQFLLQMIYDICYNMDVSLPTNSIIIDEFRRLDSNFTLDDDNLCVDYEFFKDCICSILKLSILQGRSDELYQLIQQIYDKHNENQINLLINKLSEIIPISNHTYSFTNIMYKAKNICLLHKCDNHIVNLINQIQDKIDFMNSTELSCVNNMKTVSSTYKDIISQIIVNTNYLDHIPSYIIDTISNKMLETLNVIIDKQYIKIIPYNKLIKPNPKINPLISGHLTFNNISTMPENSDHTFWTACQTYQHFKHDTETGINLYSWAIKPFNEQNSGSANLSRIDRFMSILNIHPIISSKNSASIITMTLSINIINYLSGLCGKAWEKY